jgi:hypothetical protein
MLHEGKFNPGIPQVRFPMLSLFSSALDEFELFLTHSSDCFHLDLDCALF